jgi:hypothetical protein
VTYLPFSEEDDQEEEDEASEEQEDDDEDAAGTSTLKFSTAPVTGVHQRSPWMQPYNGQKKFVLASLVSVIAHPP